MMREIEAFGVHLMLDGYSVDPALLADEARLGALLQTLPAAIGMHAIAAPLVVEVGPKNRKDPGGLSGFVLIAESHLSFHTFPIAERMSGPGGLYNTGNAIGLASGISFAILGAFAVDQTEDLVLAIVKHLAGGGGAIALALAMVLFFIGDEFYHCAYKTAHTEPDAKYLRRADARSGIGALFLDVSLALPGDVWIAITSTVLLAGGKFGNAFLPPCRSRVRFEYLTLSGATQMREIGVFRLAVVLSRITAMFGLLVGLIAHCPRWSCLEMGQL